MNFYSITQLYYMQNLPLVNFRLTLKGRNIKGTQSEGQKEKKTSQLSETTTRGYTPLHLESRQNKKQGLKKFKTNFYSSKEIVKDETIKCQKEEDGIPEEKMKNQESAKQIARQAAKVRIRKTSLHYKPKKCICGDCQECLKDFTYFLQIFSTDQNVPEITAKSWCIWRKGKNDKFIYYYGRRIHKIRQIASLTKMITAMTAIDYFQRFGYNPDKVQFCVRKASTVVGGTTACLQLDQVYTIAELLNGLMLPSGNDAAIAISEAIGLMQFLKIKNKYFNPHNQLWYESYLENTNKNFSYLFINLMNEKCKKLGLRDTHMYNSHGNDAYDQLKNVSTCNQVARISSEFVSKYEYLKKIVLRKKYEVERYEKVWQNTNKLLDDGFEGIKTGITETAGPCLAAYYKDLVIVVLNSKSMNQRWIQVKKLVKWFIKKTL